MEQPLPIRKKVLDLVGETQINAGGVNRQAELARCVPGESVTLQHQRVPGLGTGRVIVLSARGMPIGELTAQYAAMLGPLLAKGRRHRARLHCLRGGVDNYPKYGARISIAWDDRPELPHRSLDEAQLAFRNRTHPSRASRKAARANGGLTASERMMVGLSC